MSVRAQVIVMGDVIYEHPTDELSLLIQAALGEAVEKAIADALEQAQIGKWSRQESVEVRAVVKPYPPEAPTRP